MSEETIPQMRERIEALEKQTKALEKEKADAQKTNRTLKAREAFRDKGFDPSHGELFAATFDGDDITDEAVTEFATKFKLGPATGAGDTQDEEGTSDSADDAALGSMSGASSSAGQGGQPASSTEPMSREEWVKLSQSNPVAARQAIEKGRVKLREDNPFAVRR